MLRHVVAIDGAVCSVTSFAATIWVAYLYLLIHGGNDLGD